MAESFDQISHRLRAELFLYCTHQFFEQDQKP